MKTTEEPCLSDRSKCRRVGVGIYLCPENHLHLFFPEILEQAGIPITPANLEMMEVAAKEAVERQWPGMSLRHGK